MRLHGRVATGDERYRRNDPRRGRTDGGRTEFVRRPVRRRSIGGDKGVHTERHPPPEQETAEEKEIHDIWVFQYDAATQELLIKPRYYTVTDQTALQDLPVYLKAGVPSVVYAVTNTGYDNWANDGTDASWQKFRQAEQLKK